MKRLAALLIPLTLACAADDAAFQEIQSRITNFTLANGMTFIVLERHQAPVASFLTYADVGSVQEVKGITSSTTRRTTSPSNARRWCARCSTTSTSISAR